MADRDPILFRWQSIFERAAEPIFLINRRRRLLFVNQAFQELTGLTAEELCGLRCTERARAENGPAAVVAATLAPPAGVLAGEPARWVRPLTGAGGKRQRWQIDYFPLRDPQGTFWVLGRVAATPADHRETPSGLPDTLVALRERVARRHSLDDLASAHPSMERLLQQARLAAAGHVPALLVGEPGSGKRWLARAIHEHRTAGRGMFVALDGKRLPPAALAEALFGERGLARRPEALTIYLANASHLPHDVQGRIADWLKRAAEETVVSGGAERLLRLLAGCANDPEAEVRGGRFTEGLFCALSTLTIVLPPLRQRAGDLPRLAERLLGTDAVRGGSSSPALTPRALALLQAHTWPGNLRELRAALVSAGARATGRSVDVPDLPAYLQRGPAQPANVSEATLPLDRILEQVERRLIGLALAKARGNKSRAAEILAVWRPRLHRRMEALGMAAEENEAGPTAGLDESAQE